MREQVRFLLGQELRELDRVDPTMTVLDWLRLVERRTGTKEGCNEGDCGACTVAIGRLRDGRIRYQAVNACIRFVGQLRWLPAAHGRGPGRPGRHAAPGAAGDGRMPRRPVRLLHAGLRDVAVHALRNDPRRGHSTTALSPERVDDALAGNLCRCTGYAPIVAAADRMLQLSRGAPDRLAAERPDTVARLQALQDDATVTVGDHGRQFHAPATADALAELLLEHPDARIVAGATDVGLWVTKELRVLDRVIDIGRVRDLQTIERPRRCARDRRRRHLCRRDAGPGEILSRHRRGFAPPRRRAGAQRRHHRRQHRQRLADRRQPADADRARRPPACCARGRSAGTMPLEDFFIDYGKQDRRPSEFVETIRSAEARPGPPLSRLQDLETLRSGHLGGARRLRAHHRRTARSRPRGSPTAAWPEPRARARGAEAALTGQPWNEASLDAAMAALADGLHAAHRLARERCLPRQGRGQSASPPVHRDHR